MKFKQWFWYIVSIFIGIGYIAYSLMLLYYNPYYRYEMFIQREWFYVGSIIILGIIFGFIFFGSFYNEKYTEELYDDYMREMRKRISLEKENEDLKAQLNCSIIEIDRLNRINKGNSMVNESAASWEEEPPQ